MGSRCIRGSREEPTKPTYGVGKDYQEIQGQTAGEGCKQTPAWRATLTRSQLDSKRAEFWASRRTGSRHVWLTLRQAVEADHETAALLLQMAGISMPEGKIALCVDQAGQIYELPAFIINEPAAYTQEVTKPLPKPQVVFETVTIKLRRMGVQHDAALVIDTRETVAKLKEAYAAQESLAVEKLRLFFSGKELKDDESLASYYIRNDMVVQLHLRP